MVEELEGLTIEKLKGLTVSPGGLVFGDSVGVAVGE